MQIAFQKHRRKIGLSQSAAARLLGVTPGLVNHWELGRRKITAEMAVRIEKALGIDRAKIRPDLFKREG